MGLHTGGNMLIDLDEDEIKILIDSMDIDFPWNPSSPEKILYEKLKYFLEEWTEIEK